MTNVLCILIAENLQLINMMFGPILDANEESLVNNFDLNLGPTSTYV